MTVKLRIWSSAAGFSALIFYLLGVAGAVLQFIYLYLPAFKDEYMTGGDVMYLIYFIMIIAVAFFAILAIFISIFGIPKFLWLTLTFLSLACILAIPLIVLGMGNSFPYISVNFADTTEMLNFIGFWVGVGGTFLATFIGLFVPKYY